MRSDQDAGSRCSEFCTSLGESEKPNGSGTMMVDSAAWRRETSCSQLRFTTASHRQGQHALTLVSTEFDFNSVAARREISIEHWMPHN
jgi:hypothetical protein